MVKVFIVLFVGAGAAHLVSLFLRKRKIEIVTKICLVPLLLAVYVLGAKNLFVPLALALIFGWGGDVLLLKINEPRFFRLGLVSFLIGHLWYIPSFLYFTGGLNLMALGVSAAAALPLGIAIHALIKPEKTMNLPVTVYEIVILLMSLSALQLFLYRRDGWGLLVFAGSLCFLLSDTLLAWFTFRAKAKYGDFFVMLSYLAAQSGIIAGMMFVL
ncbi:MAG: lysoplasmalogenase [Spirochaetaceae bacterium]|jgi:uncharacterized membrane protein YhhN|nr:lysoplasmalogenase [Spirochaetaceae bacterium]